ncbi:MAG: glycosyltransferase, partial [Chthoniobacterales bacterium]
MHVVFTIASLAPRFGGPSRSVPALCGALRARRVDAQIVALRERRDQREPCNQLPGVKWVDCRTHRYLPIGWPKRFKRELRSAISGGKDAIVHDAGLWLPSNHYAALIAREAQVQRVVSPRGMLSAWALNHAGARKKIVWHLRQKHDLESASMLHATAETEAEEFRRCGLRAPIAVVPNGVDVPPPIPRPLRADTSQRVALFLSRLHPKKGLLDLVAAWAAVRPNGWRMVVAGPDEGGYRAVIENAVREAGILD